MDKSKFYKKYLPSIVYGGSDGAVSYFTLMAGAYGAGLPIKMLIAVGVSNIFADAFSMASADYLSEDSKAKENKSLAGQNAFVTFISFIALGVLPLIPTVYAYTTLDPSGTLPFEMFIMSSALTMLGFICIGYLRAKVLNRNTKYTILQSILICSVSAIMAYYIGEGVATFLK